MINRRANGLLLHITSLPSEYGIGDLGPQAYKFADFLKSARQSYWQVLPLNPPTPGSRNNPYNCLSAFAGNPMLISPQLLYRGGLLTKKEICDKPDFVRAKVNYRSVESYKDKLFNIAYKRFRNMPGHCEYEHFCSENKDWLDDYSLFVGLHQHFDSRLWVNWPKRFRDCNKQALKSVKRQLKDSIDREKFLQFLFSKQWHLLKQYCKQRGIKIIGDIPIYVAYDSADVWAHSELFKLSGTKKPKVVSGVPPDMFSKTGQLWNNPIYDWQGFKKQLYRWWIQRIKHNLDLFDTVRIDHFRGFVASWQVRAGSKTAINGRWVKGPGEDFLDALFGRPSLAGSIIVENLGYITRDVSELVQKLQLPGMRVLLFGFGEDYSQSPHCPHNHIKNCVVYTGTHDNNTIRGWFEKEAKTRTRKRLFSYLGDKVPLSRIHWRLIRLAMSSVADLVIIPVQDILGLDHTARMNHPARKRGNWKWRLRPGQSNRKLAEKLAAMTRIYGRD